MLTQPVPPSKAPFSHRSFPLLPCFSHVRREQENEPRFSYTLDVRLSPKVARKLRLRAKQVGFGVRTCCGSSCPGVRCSAVVLPFTWKYVPGYVHLGSTAAWSHGHTDEDKESLKKRRRNAMVEKGGSHVHMRQDDPRANASCRAGLSISTGDSFLQLSAIFAVFVQLSACSTGHPSKYEIHPDP